MPATAEAAEEAWAAPTFACMAWRAFWMTTPAVTAVVTDEVEREATLPATATVGAPLSSPRAPRRSATTPRCEDWSWVSTTPRAAKSSRPTRVSEDMSKSSAAGSAEPVWISSMPMAAYRAPGPFLNCASAARLVAQAAAFFAPTSSGLVFQRS